MGHTRYPLDQDPRVLGCLYLRRFVFRNCCYYNFVIAVVITPSIDCGIDFHVPWHLRILKAPNCNFRSCRSSRSSQVSNFEVSMSRDLKIFEYSILKWASLMSIVYWNFRTLAGIQVGISEIRDLEPYFKLQIVLENLSTLRASILWDIPSVLQILNFEKNITYSLWTVDD